MPWSVRAKGGQYLVVNKESGRVMGRHSTRAKALKQLRAIYANYGRGKG